MKTPRWTGSTTERPCNVGRSHIMCTPTMFGPDREQPASRLRVYTVGSFIDWYLRQRIA